MDKTSVSQASWEEKVLRNRDGLYLSRMHELTPDLKSARRIKNDEELAIVMNSEHYALDPDQGWSAVRVRVTLITVEQLEGDT